jgi:hypothetical protein
MSANAAPISDQQQLSWLREKAQRHFKAAEEETKQGKLCNKWADEMERDLKKRKSFGSKFAAVPPAKPGEESASPNLGSANIGDLRRYLSVKGGRPAHVAAHFKVPTEEIQRLVSLPDSGIVVAERGWLKLTEDGRTQVMMDSF